MDASQGLAAEVAAERLARDGPNEIQQEEGRRPLALIVEQLRSPLIALLIGACVLSAALGEVADAVAIAAIVLLNAAVGFAQEYRAERALAALRAMTAPRARVVRDGRLVQIPATEVVRGDLLALEAGDLVAADARLVEANVLSASEAALTGESLPVEKRTEPARAGAPLAERRDCVFMGTAVATGTGHAEVFATGMATELGKIARLIATAEETATPLQHRLEGVSRTLLWMCLGVVAVVAALGLVRNERWLDVLLFSVSLAVAAVPEGLPAVVTIALAVGVQRMAARNVLVRRLQAVETLGTATVVCTDKTGTLTTGEMRVREIWPSPEGAAGEARVLEVATACCDAELAPSGDAGTGDPTEVAILLAARQRGILRGEIERARPRAQVNPFDSERKRMSILRADGTLYAKGALESLLPICSAGTAGAVEANAEMAARSLRVLAIATGRGREEKELALVGLLGIADPPRPEAIAALDAARTAGVKTIMVTGDHPATAAAIAREMRLLGPSEAPGERVVARATAADKLELVRALKKRGEIVAMTGDGVNDAPALREAHIGVAMGRTGTEVTREAADMVLADDNYASLVAAIREGRAIYENIRRALVYLLAGNAGELLFVFLASALALPIPLLPLHLLWVNLVTDSLPALALVVEPAAADVLRRPPRSPGEALLGRSQWAQVLLIAVVEGSCVLGVFVWAFRTTGDVPYARTLAMSTLVLSEVVRSLGARSEKRVLFEVGIFTNPRLLWAIGVSVALQVALLSLEPARALFELRILAPAEYAGALGVALVPLSALETAKLIVRRFRRAGRDAPHPV